MKRTLNYQIGPESAGLSIEKFLKNQGYSSANITAIKKMPMNVTIDGIWVHMNQLLEKGQNLAVNIDEDSSSANIPAVPIPLDIVYEDQDIIVINKPAGLSIHPSLNHYEDSLANGLAYYYQSQGIPFIFRCVNRLDKNTSGLTVIAKHLVSANILSNAVKERQMHRLYYAIVEGCPNPKKGTIDAPIGRVDDSIITRQVDFENGQRAITHYELIAEKNGHSLVSIQLETGRTHQIRVHFKYIGNPLLGDIIYNPDMRLINRHALHSGKLSFIHPISKKPMEFVAPLPGDMERALNS
ncbi:MAG: RluA family pseudouridine synthase [Pseudobutyrivibrio sp.]|nr:RluA family pseudouridine synthase [Pseudobutyrivibrio sp.]